MLIGDALAVPSHGYTNPTWIDRDYGTISGYVPLKEPHPTCEMARIRYAVIEGKNNILHHRGVLWKRGGTHYHHGLDSGENTLPVSIALQLAESLRENDGVYSSEDFLKRYLTLMLSPDGHRDTYIPAAHRSFFENLGRGFPPERCATDDAHIAGLVELSPILFALCGAVPEVNRCIRRHLKLLHPSATIIHGADLTAEMLVLLFSGNSLEKTIYEKLGHAYHPFFAYPFRSWIAKQSDEFVAGRCLGAGALIDDAMPLALFLALKYAGNFKMALQANAALGGDSCNRGAIVGMLMGAQCGCEGIPDNLANGLKHFAALDKIGDALWEIAEKKWAGRLPAVG